MKSNFSSSWNTFWSAISGQLGGVLTIMTWVGVVLVVFSVVGWIYKKRQGGSLSQGLSGVFITMVVGMVLCSPQLLIPLILRIVDFVANTAASLLQRASA